MVGVATENWRERILAALGKERISTNSGKSQGVIWCDNVYDGVARAVELKRSQSNGVVLIMIDCLSAEEMRVFQTLKQIERIKSVGLSMVSNRGKMDRAKLLGADEVFTIQELSEKIKQRNPRELSEDAVNVSIEPEGRQESPPVSKEPVKAVSVEESLATLTAEAIADLEKTIKHSMGQEGSEEQDQETDVREADEETPPIRPERKPPAKKVNESEDDRPLLSKEELDALMGDD